MADLEINEVTHGRSAADQKVLQLHIRSSRLALKVFQSYDSHSRGKGSQEGKEKEVAGTTQHPQKTGRVKRERRDVGQFIDGFSRGPTTREGPHVIDHEGGSVACLRPDPPARLLRPKSYIHLS